MELISTLWHSTRLKGSFTANMNSIHMQRWIYNSSNLSPQVSSPLGTPGGHPNGKRGYQARPWTHKKHPTYFSGMKIDPKYVFLHAFFLICLSCPFQNNCLYDQKHTFFPNFARFCTPKRCTRVHCLVLKNNPNYVNFWTSLIPLLTFQCPPPGGDLTSGDLTCFLTLIFFLTVWKRF